MKLTSKNIKAMRYSGRESRPGQWSQDIRWDDEIPGFGVRIYPPKERRGQDGPTSIKSFVLFYRSGGRQHIMVLGRFGVLTADEARSMAKKKLAAIYEGENPLETKKAHRQKRTFRELMDAFVKNHASTKKTGRAMEARLNRHIPKKWLSRLAEDITDDDIAEVHRRIGIDGGKPYEANRLLEILRSMYNLASQPGWRFVPARHRNPTTDIRKHREKKRKVWVTPEQMKPLIREIQKEPNIYVRAAIWTLLLTGMRKSEVLNAKREDIDWTRAMLKLSDPKAGVEQEVPLNKPAVAILSALPPKSEDNPYLFAGHRRKRPLVNIDIAWSRIRKAAGVPEVHIHDLRRTVGSWLSQNNADLNVIKEALRHASIDTTLTYARLGADPAREVMEAHGQRLQEAAGAMSIVGEASNE